MARRVREPCTLAQMDLVIVDDHPAVRAGLRGLIEDEDDLRVAATAASAREGFEAIADARPAVALIDLNLPDDDGLSLCLRTRALPEPPRVVIYSALADEMLDVLAAIAGADAVVSKSAPPHVLLDDPARAGSGRRSTRARCGPSAPAFRPTTWRSSGCWPTASARRRSPPRSALDAEALLLPPRRDAAARRPLGRGLSAAATMWAHAHERPDPRGAEGRHRS